MKKIMAITLLIGAQSAFGMDADDPVLPLPLYLQLTQACEFGNQTTVESLLARGADANAQNAYGQTPLTLAFHGRLGTEGRRKMVRTLLAAKADANLTSRETGNSPLILAANYRDLPTVQLLLDANANVHATNKSGKTALDFAADDEVKTLLQAAIQLK